MKKLIVLVLGLITACFALVSCDEAIGGDLQGYKDKNWDKTDTREEVELDLFIITGDETMDAAKKTVNQKINSHLAEKYKVTLDIHYIKASEYNAAVTAGISATDAKDKADIVLINGKTLYDELMNGGKLAPLDGYLDSSTIKNYAIISQKIPEIKKDIPACLWEASASSADSNGNTCFVIPNNRAIGEYEYLVIDREQFFAKANSLNLFDTDSDGNYCTKSDFDVDSFIADIGEQNCFKDTGAYSEKAVHEADGNLCVIISKPTVNAEYVLESGFSVVKGTGYEDRAMEIIYALNTDATFRNLLQYGDVLTHYNIVEGDIVRKVDETAQGIYNEIYRMDLLYTGNIFKAEYCSELGWTKDARADADIHNKNAAVYVAPSVTPPAE